MQDFLQQLDLDYYRSALLLVARADLERLRQERSSPTGAGPDRPANIAPDASPSADSGPVQVSPDAAH